jgi:nucleoside-diphosphate-sugar epimerase
MRILITGATGFVGCHLVAQLAAKHELYALVRDAVPMPGAVRSVYCNLASPIELDCLPKHVEAVVHLAQSRRGREFPEGAEDMLGVNVASTNALLQYALREGVKHFILASTGSVYSVMQGAANTAPPTPAASYYAASKLAAELLARAYHQHLSVCTLRLFTPYGPGQYDRLVSDLIDRVTHERPVMIVGDRDGFQFHPTFITDVVAVIDRALQERWDGTYDVANAQGVSIRQAAEQIGVAVHKMPTFERQMGPEQPLMLPNLAALRDRFPIGTFCPFDRGLQATINAQTARV